MLLFPVSAEPDHQRADVRRTHARYARRLSEVLRAYLPELLPRFQAQHLDLIIVKIRRYAPFFRFPELLYLRALAADITLVADGDLH